MFCMHCTGQAEVQDAADHAAGMGHEPGHAQIHIDPRPAIIVNNQIFYTNRTDSLRSSRPLRYVIFTTKRFFFISFVIPRSSAAIGTNQASTSTASTYINMYDRVKTCMPLCLSNSLPYGFLHKI